MRHAAHGAKKAKRQNDSLLSLFATSTGSHGKSRSAVGSVAGSAVGAVATNPASVAGSAVSPVVSSVTSAVASEIQGVFPLTRREIRLAHLASVRHKRLVVSATVAAMFASVVAIMYANDSSYSSFAKSQDLNSTYENNAENASNASNANASKYSDPVAVSRSYDRSALNNNYQNPNSNSNADKHAVAVESLSTASSHQSKWNLDSTDDFDVSELSRSIARNPQVALFMDDDAGKLPKGFNPNHESGDVGNAYEFSQCTWWVYIRRHQLGLPVGSRMGDGAMWAYSASRLGYWVDNSARHKGDIMVFAPGQAGSNIVYGHVAIVEKINPDGSIETSECSVELNGRTISRKFAAKDLKNFKFIHY
ncbi:CHAP domain-containing protein [Gardnerella vaginalis]|uniref:CHAP domain-containing protein n=1 Tax=Gardnerella vaginalis TaxID=2702 RepID=UPI0039EF42B9